MADEKEDVRDSAAGALRQIAGELVAPSLIQALAREENNLRAPAAELIVDLGLTTVPALIAAMAGEDRYERDFAAEVLVRTGAPAVPYLIPLLAAEDGEARATVAWALGRIGDAQAVPALIQSLADEDQDVRDNVVQALGQIGDAGAVTSLIRTLDDAAENVRDSAAWALGQIGDVAAAPALIQVLDGEDNDLRVTAASSLGQIGDNVAVPSLVQTLGDENHELCITAAKSLGLIGDSAAAPGLIQALGDEDSDMRAAAARSLGQIGDNAAVPALLRTVTDKGEDEDVRENAAKALGQIGDEAAVPALRRVAYEDTSAAFIHARFALQKILAKGEESSETTAARWDRELDRSDIPRLIFGLTRVSFEHDKEVEGLTNLMGSADFAECQTIIRRILWYAPEIPAEFYDLLDLAAARFTTLQLEPVDPEAEQPRHWLRRLIFSSFTLYFAIGVVSILLLRVLLAASPVGQLLETLSERYWESQPFLVKALIFIALVLLYPVADWLIGKIRYRYWRRRL